MSQQTVRFGVELERKVEGELAEIARQIERRPKTDFHRVLCNRIVRLWKEKPQELEALGLIRRGY